MTNERANAFKFSRDSKSQNRRGGRSASLSTFALVALLTLPALAGPTSKAVREAAEYVLQKFTREAGEETIESLSGKIAGLAARHGDEAVEAVRRVGPRTFRLVEEAGEHGPQAVKLLARAGDEAVWVVSRPRSLAMFARYGDDAADAMIRHRQIAEPLLEAYGPSAARALKAVDGQGGRRLAMMFQDGDLARLGRTDELLGLVERFGNRALAFIWRHKGALAGGVVLAAFISNPQPYLDGVIQLTDRAGERVIQPIAREAARSVNWTLVALVALALIVIVALAVTVRARRRSPPRWA